LQHSIHFSPAFGLGWEGQFLSIGLKKWTAQHLGVIYIYITREIMAKSTCVHP